jgi:hypothetical protein
MGLDRRRSFMGVLVYLKDNASVARRIEIADADLAALHRTYLATASEGGIVPLTLDGSESRGAVVIMLTASTPLIFEYDDDAAAPTFDGYDSDLGWSDSR